MHEAHTLSADEARRGYPVHFCAVVTYFDKTLSPHGISFFFHDATGGIYANAPLSSVWPQAPQPGSLVDVTGITAPGYFAPIIEQAHITVIGTSHLPTQAKPVALPELISGVDDSQWVEVEGVVHSVIESRGDVILKIAMTSGSLVAATVKRPGVDYQPLVDKWVHIRGDAATTYNANRQITGARLFFPGLESIDAVAPGPLRAFDLPVEPISGLLRYNPGIQWLHRTHVRGTVTLDWPGRTVCIRDSTGGLCAQTDQTTPIAVGSSVDIIGFTALAGFTPTLEDAEFQPHPGSSEAVTPVPLSPERALQGDYDSKLVQIEGRLIGRDLASTDVALILSAGQSSFRVSLPADESTPAIAAIPIGSNLRVIGICNVQVDRESTVRGFGITRASRFWIFLRSPNDIQILQTPSWWTTSRIGLLLLGTLALTAAGFIWVVILRRRVEQQTRELRESREIFRHMAHHDPLTGLATRTLFNDRLQTALDRAQRFHAPLALLMLDVDHFKQINDSLGHQAGDRVLCITAQRIAASIRKTDSLARMGGDEFVVLLNDLDDTTQAEHIAVKIIDSASAPIPLGDNSVTVSVSIGIYALSGDETLADVELLLRHADTAMYGAKARGRGCYHVFANASAPQPEADPTSNVLF